MRRASTLLLGTLLGALLTTSCVITSQSGSVPPARPPTKIDFSPVVKVAKNLASAQQRALIEGTKAQTAKDAARLVDGYSAAIYAFCGTVDDFLRYTPGLNNFNEKSAEAKQFTREMGRINLQPTPGLVSAWTALMLRFENEPEMIAAKSNFLSAEQRLKQWLDQFGR